MPSDTNARAVLIRGLSPRVFGALQSATEDIGVTQTAVVKMALRDWLTERGYLPAPPTAPTPQARGQTQGQRESEGYG